MTLLALALALAVVPCTLLATALPPLDLAGPQRRDGLVQLAKCENANHPATMWERWLLKFLLVPELQDTFSKFSSETSADFLFSFFPFIGIQNLVRKY